MKAPHIWVAFVFTLPFVLSRPGTTVAPKENAACKSGKVGKTLCFLYAHADSDHKDFGDLEESFSRPG